MRDLRIVSPFMSPVDFVSGPFAERVNVRNKEIEMTNATVQGASSDYFQMGVTSLAEGRFFTTDEETRRAKVAVIGVDVANTLFPFSNALGEEIQIEVAIIKSSACSVNAKFSLSERKTRTTKTRRFTCPSRPSNSSTPTTRTVLS
jgi:hypothetical protein